MIESISAPAVGLVWRLGHRNAPLDYAPRYLCSWRNRFDDPQRLYRSLYAARHSETCLRELLADLRPNAIALSEFESLFGGDPGFTIAGVVSPAWRRAHVLIRAAIFTVGHARLARIESRRTLNCLKRDHVSLLAGLGIHKLNLSVIRSRDRIITQQFSRTLYQTGAAGIAFKSRLDGRPCFTIFEGRGSFRKRSRPIPMTDDWPELVRLYGEYNLLLRPA